MSYESRGQGRYYYSARRVGGRVAKTYVGRGAAAENAAKAVTDAKTRRVAEAAAYEQEKARCQPLDHAWAGFEDASDWLIEAGMIAAGYVRRRGEWRKMRHGRRTPKTS